MAFVFANSPFALFSCSRNLRCYTTERCYTGNRAGRSSLVSSRLLLTTRFLGSSECRARFGGHLHRRRSANLNDTFQSAFAVLDRETNADSFKFDREIQELDSHIASLRRETEHYARYGLDASKFMEGIRTATERKTMLQRMRDRDLTRQGASSVDSPQTSRSTTHASPPPPNSLAPRQQSPLPTGMVKSQDIDRLQEDLEELEEILERLVEEEKYCKTHNLDGSHFHDGIRLAEKRKVALLQKIRMAKEGQVSSFDNSGDRQGSGASKAQQTLLVDEIAAIDLRVERMDKQRELMSRSQMDSSSVRDGIRSALHLREQLVMQLKALGAAPSSIPPAPVLQMDSSFAAPTSPRASDPNVRPSQIDMQDSATPQNYYSQDRRAEGSPGERSTSTSTPTMHHNRDQGDHSEEASVGSMLRAGVAPVSRPASVLPAAAVEELDRLFSSPPPPPPPIPASSPTPHVSPIPWQHSQQQGFVPQNDLEQLLVEDVQRVDTEIARLSREEAYLKQKGIEGSNDGAGIRIQQQLRLAQERRTLAIRQLALVTDPLAKPIVSAPTPAPAPAPASTSSHPQYPPQPLVTPTLHREGMGIATTEGDDTAAKVERVKSELSSLEERIASIKSEHTYFTSLGLDPSAFNDALEVAERRRVGLTEALAGLERSGSGSARPLAPSLEESGNQAEAAAVEQDQDGDDEEDDEGEEGEGAEEGEEAMAVADSSISSQEAGGEGGEGEEEEEERPCYGPVGPVCGLTEVLEEINELAEQGFEARTINFGREKAQARTVEEAERLINLERLCGVWDFVYRYQPTFSASDIKRIEQQNMTRVKAGEEVIRPSVALFLAAKEKFLTELDGMFTYEGSRKTKRRSALHRLPTTRASKAQNSKRGKKRVSGKRSPAGSSRKRKTSEIEAGPPLEAYEQQSWEEATNHKQVTEKLMADLEATLSNGSLSLDESATDIDYAAHQNGHARQTSTYAADE